MLIFYSFCFVFLFVFFPHQPSLIFFLVVCHPRGIPWRLFICWCISYEYNGECDIFLVIYSFFNHPFSYEDPLWDWFYQYCSFLFGLSVNFLCWFLGPSKYGQPWWKERMPGRQVARQTDSQADRWSNGKMDRQENNWSDEMKGSLEFSTAMTMMMMIMKYFNFSPNMVGSYDWNETL